MSVHGAYDVVSKSAVVEHWETLLTGAVRL